MSGATVDLRSEAVAGLHPEVRAALAEGPDGNDVYDEDPAVRELEEHTRSLFGMRSALYVPTGRMANTVAAGVLCEPSAELIVEAQSHLMTSEFGMASRLWGLVARTYVSPRGVVAASQILPLLEVNASTTVPLGMIAVEDTHLDGGGVPQDLGAVRELRSIADSHGGALYCDGARIWYAAAVRGDNLGTFAEMYDAMAVSLVKGPSAPVGAVVMFREDFRSDARRIRQMLGGAWARPGAMARAALKAMEVSLPRLGEQCSLAQRLAANVREAIGPDHVTQYTNIVRFDVHDASAFFDQCAQAGLLLFRHSPHRMRAVVHATTRPEDIDRASAVIGRVFAHC
jgi:threonine aldolase